MMNSRDVSILYRTTRRKQYQKGQRREGYEFTEHKIILGESVWKWQVFRTIFCQLPGILNATILSLRLENQRIETIRFAKTYQAAWLNMPFDENPAKWIRDRRPLPRFAYAPQRLPGQPSPCIQFLACSKTLDTTAWLRLVRPPG